MSPVGWTTLGMIMTHLQRIEVICEDWLEVPCLYLVWKFPFVVLKCALTIMT